MVEYAASTIETRQSVGRSVLDVEDESRSLKHRFVLLTILQFLSSLRCAFV